MNRSTRIRVARRRDLAALVARAAYDCESGRITARQEAAVVRRAVRLVRGES